MKTHRLFGAFLAVIMVFMLASVAAAQDAGASDTPSVTASDQESDGSQVTVDEVAAAVEGWIVIHRDADGKPGPILGQTAIPGGTTENVVVMLGEALAEDANLWAMLHVDEGEAGTFEFPNGPDVPAKDGDKIVIAPFMVTVAGEEMDAEETDTEEMAAEETESEEMAAEETESEEMDAEETESEEMDAEETDAEEMEAPTQLPETGAAPTSLPVTFAVAGAVLAVLFGGVAVMRRRT